MPVQTILGNYSQEEERNNIPFLSHRTFTDDEVGLDNQRMLKKASHRQHRRKNSTRGKNKLPPARLVPHWRQMSKLEESMGNNNRDNTRDEDAYSHDDSEAYENMPEELEKGKDNKGRKEKEAPEPSSSCPCGKPNSRNCRRRKCAFSLTLGDTDSDIVHSSRAIERRKKKEQRKERMQAYLDQKQKAQEKQTKRIERLRAKATNISCIVSESLARASMNKKVSREQHLSKIKEHENRTMLGQARLRSKIHSAQVSAQCNIPILSETTTLSTSTHWFEPVDAHQDRVSAAVSKLVNVSDFSDKNETCAVCACELLESEGDNIEENSEHLAHTDEIIYISTCSVKHFFHRSCIVQSFRYGTNCPTCLTAVVPVIGPQPDGTMTVRIDKTTVCSGHSHNSQGTIVITYTFPSGIQGLFHPHPSAPYSGTLRQAFLPNNSEGRNVLALLQLAFDRRQIFTVGTSLTTGLSNTIVWNSIHHKTAVFGGMFGYPDPTYLARVKDELVAALRMSQ
eukprot:m.15982 g.15982  ORF g.15982 m.15982 type:complete len:509 (+) comp4553_c0_seq1:267-1793(+)